MRALLVVVLLFGTGLAGCLAPLERTKDCPRPELRLLSGPLDANGHAVAGARGGPGMLFWAQHNHTREARMTIEAMSLPNRKSVGLENFAGTEFGELPPGFVMFGGMRQAEASATSYEVAAALYTKDCFEDNDSKQTLPLNELVGKTVRAGQGALVRTAGFWTNGTLFYTNIERVHQDANISRAGWYEYTDDTPLKVYVYNMTRTEMPKRYNESGYSTTILGFNAALKNTETGTSQVANLPPANAYTIAGNEKHRLYGDQLIFYIEVVDLAVVACRVPVPANVACPDV